MDIVQQLLLLSEKLCSTLEVFVEDKDDQRDKQISLVDKLLDARGQTIDTLLKQSNTPLKGHKDEVRLNELNRMIIKRLDEFKNVIASDIRSLQVSKKQEERYVNPYSSLQNIDGTYFDGRK